jgi:ubiquinone/menaquinone biosynthesis C-methylase UbiE
MQTIEWEKMRLPPGARILDAGCGTGRHVMSGHARGGLKIVGIDVNREDILACRRSIEEYAPLFAVERGKEGRGAQENGSLRPLLLQASLVDLPFREAAFDAVICSEVLEHIPDFAKAITELIRVLKKGGVMAISVPRFLPERICWALSRSYGRQPGGHLRVFGRRELMKLLSGKGMRLLGVRYRHALHSPYWWLKCLVGPDKDGHRLVVAYRRLLEWEIMAQPAIMAKVERLLGPVLGKSIVFYLRKG